MQTTSCSRFWRDFIGHINHSDDCTCTALCNFSSFQEFKVHLRTFTQYTIRCSLTVCSPGREWWGSWCLQHCPVFLETLQLFCNQVAPVISRDKLSSPSSLKEDTVRTNTCALNYTAGLVKCIWCGEFTIMDFTITIIFHTVSFIYITTMCWQPPTTLCDGEFCTCRQHSLFLQKMYKFVSFSATLFHTFLIKHLFLMHTTERPHNSTISIIVIADLCTHSHC